MAAADFFIQYLNGPLPCVRRDIIIYKMCSVRRKIKYFFPSLIIRISVRVSLGVFVCLFVRVYVFGGRGAGAEVDLCLNVTVIKENA